MEMLAERGIDVSNETMRRWFLNFGDRIAASLRRARPRPKDRSHLDEMVIRIRRRRLWLWRAVDDEGEVLDLMVRRRRCARSAKKLMRTLLKTFGLAWARATAAAWRAAADRLPYPSKG